MHNSSKKAALTLGWGCELPHGAIGQVLPASGDALLAVTGQLKNVISKS